MNVLGYTVAVVINILLVAAVARRVLGVPIGWPRTILLAALVQTATSGLLQWSANTLDVRIAPTSPHVAQSVLVVFLIVAWLFAAQLTLLAILEAFAPTGTIPSPWSVLRSLPARQRRALRYTAILRIAARHGLGSYLRRSSGSTLLPQEKLAVALRNALVEGGVTFVKLGQMLSARPDLVPAAFINELSTLQMSVPARPWSEVKEVLEADLGRPASEVFAHVEEQPLAAASVGQVHRARLHSGEAVVVKVQRREARAQVTADLDIVLRLANWLERTTAWAPQLGVRQLAKEFATSLEEELDYRVELGNMRSVAYALEQSGRTNVTMPVAHPELSSRHVLVMSQLSGESVGRAGPRLARMGADTRHQLSIDLLSVMMHQIMVSGVFHADLHPGNIFITDDGGIGLLDFGSVGRLDATARTSIGMLLAAFDHQDTLAATNALLEVLDAGTDLDTRHLERDVGQLLLRHSGPGASTAGLFIELFRVVMRYGIAVPGQVALAFRAIGALEGSLKAISPTIDAVAETRAQQGELVAEFMGPEKMRQSFNLQLASMLPMLERLPRRLNRISEDLEAGRLTVGVRAFAHPEDRRFLSVLMHQFVLALLATACTLAGVILVTSPGGPQLTPVVSLWPFLGFVLLFFAFVLAARVLVVVFTSNDVRARGGRT